MAYPTEKAETEEHQPATKEELREAIAREDRYVDSRFQSLRTEIETLKAELNAFKEKFEMLVTLLAGKKIITGESVEKKDLKKGKITEWYVKNRPTAQVSPEYEHEINFGVCEYCGRFNLGTPEKCEYCGKSLEKKPIISPTEGV